MSSRNMLQCLDVERSLNLFVSCVIHFHSFSMLSTLSQGAESMGTTFLEYVGSTVLIQFMF